LSRAAFFERLALLGSSSCWSRCLRFSRLVGATGGRTLKGDAMGSYPDWLWCRRVHARPLRSRYWCQRLSASARGRAAKTPTLLDVLGVRERLKPSKSRTRSSASAGLEPTSYNVTNTYRWGWHTMSKRNLIIEEGSVEAMARLQKQDEEFCRRLRAAIETGRERRPTTVFTEPCTNRPVSNYMRPD